MPGLFYQLPLNKVLYEKKQLNRIGMKVDRENPEMRMYRENPKTSVLAVLKDAGFFLVFFFFFHLQPVKENTEKDLSNKTETRSQGEDQILSMVITFLVKHYKWFKIVHRKSFS